MDDRPIPTSLSRGKGRAEESETKRGINGGGRGVEVDTVGRAGGGSEEGFGFHQRRQVRHECVIEIRVIQMMYGHDLAQRTQTGFNHIRSWLARFRDHRSRIRIRVRVRCLSWLYHLYKERCY